MIVRLMSEGQFDVPDRVVAELDRLDHEAVQAVESDDQEQLVAALSRMGALVRGEGERLHDSHLETSDLIIPPADLSIEEARRLFGEEGLIPDLPAQR